MNVLDALFSLSILVLIGIYSIYWAEARRAASDPEDDPPPKGLEEVLGEDVGPARESDGGGPS